MDAIIFDCDGVLVDSEAICEQVIGRLLAAELPGFDAASFIATTTGRRDEEIAPAILAAHGIVLPDDFLERMVQAIDLALAEEVVAIPGAAAAVAAVTLPKAVASNSPPDRLERSLIRTGLRSFFAADALVSASLVTWPKPAPDVYLLAAARLGADPARCLVVEDSVAGVTAATAAGMTVLGFTGASHVVRGQAEMLRAVGAVEVVETMRAVTEWVSRTS